VAFGFPAKYTGQYKVRKKPDDLRQVICDSIEMLGWEVVGEDQGNVYGVAGTDLLSWGEKITINYSNQDFLEITSACSSSMQFIDWGKNSSNVKEFIRQVRKNA
jgi:hypothetical protein